MDEFPKETKLNICKDLLRMNYLQYSPKLLIIVYVTISEKKKAECFKLDCFTNIFQIERNNFKYELWVWFL